MPSSFVRAWGSGGLPKPGLADRLRMLINRNPQLRLKIVQAIRVLERDVRRLNATLERFENMEKRYEEEAKDAARAGKEDVLKALANSIAAIRNYKRVVMFMKICFELICAKLRIVLETGDVVAAVSPVSKIIKVVGPVVAKVMPQLEGSITMVRDVLDTLTNNIDFVTESVVPIELESKEARDIFEAIKLAVEQEADLALPEVEVDIEGSPVRRREGLRNRGGMP